MFGHIEMQYATPVVRQHNQGVQHAKSRNRHGHEVNRDDLSKVIVEERAPGL
jgi:hypothetical protein